MSLKIGEAVMSLNRTKKLPIGIENFEKLRREDFYYIDKTGFLLWRKPVFLP